MENANTVTITAAEYKELVELATKGNVLIDRVNAFARYVNADKYAVEREICGAILGFEVSSIE